jgi:hypothetical protein
MYIVEFIELIINIYLFLNFIDYEIKKNIRLQVNLSDIFMILKDFHCILS